MSMTAFIAHDALTAHTVLLTATDSLERQEEKPTALRLIRESYDAARKKRRTLRIEDLTIRGAQAHILGIRVAAPVFPPRGESYDRLLFERTAKAWLLWAAGKDPLPFLEAIPKPATLGGAIHLMSLEPWSQAVRALTERNFQEACRLFRRSVEIGDQYGTETREAVSWTYVASFFHRGTETRGV